MWRRQGGMSARMISNAEHPETSNDRRMAIDFGIRLLGKRALGHAIDELRACGRISDCFHKESIGPYGISLGSKGLHGVSWGRLEGIE